MTILDKIFTAYFAIVPYNLLLAIMTGVVIFEFLYVFVSRFDML